MVAIPISLPMRDSQFAKEVIHVMEKLPIRGLTCFILYKDNGTRLSLGRTGDMRIDSSNPAFQGIPCDSVTGFFADKHSETFSHLCCHLLGIFEHPYFYPFP